MDPDDLVGIVSSVPDGPGAAPLSRFVGLIRSTERPWDRLLYVPGHLTASAFVFAPSLDRVAVVDHPIIGRPLQPGGHVEETDHDLEAAARREVSEELGLDEVEARGVIDLDVHRFPRRSGAPGHLHFDVRFLFVSRTDALMPRQGEAPARWVAIDEVDVLEPGIGRAVSSAVRLVA